MLFYSIKNVAVHKKLKIMFILNVFVPQSLTGNHKCVNNSSSSPSCHLTVTTAELAGQFWQLRIWAASPVYAHLLLLHLSYSIFFSFFFFISKHHDRMSVKQPRSYFQRLYYSTIVLPSKLIFTEVWPKGILQSSVWGCNEHAALQGQTDPVLVLVFSTLSIKSYWPNSSQS